MKKVLTVLDKITAAIIENIAAIMTAAIFLIVVIVVILRFIFQTSSGGIEELPTYFLMIAIWFGAAICARNPKEGLIRIDLFETLLRNKPMPRTIMNIAASVLTISCIGLYAKLSWDYVIFSYEAKQTTLALGFPMWILTGLTFLACFFLLIYEIVTLVRSVHTLRSVIAERRAVS
jgi:TRAP-type C4-dicarboxylate transport system permease small subunit